MLCVHAESEELRIVSLQTNEIQANEIQSNEMLSLRARAPPPPFSATPIIRVG
jgi:hypothetical protein